MDGWNKWRDKAPQAPPLRGRRYHVFLSHRTTDREWVTSLRNILESRGFQSFQDYSELMPGDSLSGEFGDALEMSQSGMLIWSVNTGGSTWVQDEYLTFQRLAGERDDFVVLPVKLDSAPLPEDFNDDITFTDFSDSRHGSSGYKVVQLMYALRGEDMPKELIDLEFPGLADRVTGPHGSYDPSEAGLRAGFRGAEPKAERKPRRHQLTVGTNPGAFYGRKDQRKELRRALLQSGHDVIAVVGRPGIGRLSLVRDLLADDALRPQLETRYPHGIGVVPDIVATAGVADVQAALWDQFWFTPDHTYVDLGYRIDQLGRVAALVVMPNCHLSDDEVQAVAASMPDTTFVVTAEHAGGGADRTTIVMPPLGRKHAVKLFDDELGIPLPELAAGAVGELTERVDGRPGLIRLLAHRAKTDVVARTPPDQLPEALRDWAAALAGQQLDPMLRSLLTESALRVVVASQVIGPDVDMPRAVLVDLAQSAEAVDDAVMLGALDHGSPRGRALPAMAEAVHVANPDAVMERVLIAAKDWIWSASGDDRFEDRAFVIRVLEWAVDNDRWEDVLTLAKALEESLAVGGRWAAWEDVLQQSRLAARSIDPPRPDREADAVHQLAVQAAVTMDHQASIDRLAEAAELRKVFDPEALEVTQQNKRLIPFGSAWLLALLVGFGCVVGVAAGSIIGGMPDGSDEVVLDVEAELLLAGDEDAQITVTHVVGPAVVVTDVRDGTTSVVAEAANTPDGDGPPSCIGRAIDEGDSCRVTLATVPAQGPLSVIVETVDGGEVDLGGHPEAADELLVDVRTASGE